jgi:CRISPR-associated endonuclease/helicase Cas3
MNRPWDPFQLAEVVAMNELNFFCRAFAALTDVTPLRWQERLYQEMLKGDLPSVCDLPTGLGKTMVIPIWMIALAKQPREGADKSLPRRLIYIVNRRTVVDQATSVVEQIRQRLLDPEGHGLSAHKEALRALAEALKGLASTGDPLLAVSTLRGELADNEEWKGDPARAAVIIGTVDMIGSKLLFSGYGDGRYWRAQHAGLLGQDSLIVHDEAHLTPAFSDLLHGLAAVQRQSRELRPVHVMELSATPRGGAGPVLKLEPEDEDDQVTGKVVKDRLDATKSLCLHHVKPREKRTDGAKERVEKLVELSLQHRDAKAKVLVYVRSPEKAQEVVDLLRRRSGRGANGCTALLTGTIRGHERDRLVREHPVYRAFLDPNVSIERTVYLVSTSSGEVGIDIDADHMVCDLTTLDSMIQRLGRVNRRGGQGRKARVDVVIQTEEPDEEDTLSEVEEAVRETRAILELWEAQSNGATDVSPRRLRALLAGLDEQCREKAFTPSPVVPPLTDILLDAWSLTSITEQMPGRPEVASYLHGLEKEIPETLVVWRKEVAFLDETKVDRDTLSDWFQACRIEARERLRDRTDQVKQTLEALLKEHRKTEKDEGRDFPVVVLYERGEARWSSLSQITDKGFDLASRTVVLPVEAGGLNEHGGLAAKEVQEFIDVGEEMTPDATGQRRQRWLEVHDEEGLRYERLLTGEEAKTLPQGLKERERIALEQAPEDTHRGGRYLLLMTEPGQSALDHPETAKTLQPLEFHLNLTVECMRRITAALGLEKTIEEALAIAAEGHDRGKNRLVWQRYACNSDLATPLAKSTRYLDGRFLGGYRHEFGSLLDGAADEKIRRHPEADLILHLIAAHHGWARPHFERNARDNTHTTAANEEAAAEAMRRFARLQQRFGRWGLAWLESLVRCADITASGPDAQPLAIPSDTEVNQ